MEKTSIGLSQNVTAALAYFFAFVSGIVLLLVEKQNKFVRFHAMQSTILFGAVFVVNWVLSSFSFLGIDVLWFFLSIPLGLLIFVLWIVLMVKAYQGEEYKLPVVGDFAVKQLGKLKI